VTQPERSEAAELGGLAERAGFGPKDSDEEFVGKFGELENREIGKLGNGRAGAWKAQREGAIGIEAKVSRLFALRF